MKKMFLLLVLVCPLFQGVAHAVPMSFTADIGDFIFPVPRGSTATATGSFSLNEAMDALTYEISFTGLDLKEDPADRTAATDITAIHFHLGGPAEIGPHSLNVFGVTLGAIVEDDADLVVDWDANTLSGVWDDLDLTDPGLSLPEPAQSIPLSSVLEELFAGGIYVNIHTVTWPAGEIRGQIMPRSAGVPVVAVHWLLGPMLIVLALIGRRSRKR